MTGPCIPAPPAAHPHPHPPPPLPSSPSPALLLQLPRRTNPLGAPASYCQISGAATTNYSQNLEEISKSFEQQNREAKRKIKSSVPAPQSFLQVFFIIQKFVTVCPAERELLKPQEHFSPAVHLHDQEQGGDGSWSLDQSEEVPAWAGERDPGSALAHEGEARLSPSRSRSSGPPSKSPSASTPPPSPGPASCSDAVKSPSTRFAVTAGDVIR